MAGDVQGLRDVDEHSFDLLEFRGRTDRQADGRRRHRISLATDGQVGDV